MDSVFLEARKEYISRIRKELLGPGSEIVIPDIEHELISSAPDVRYSIGVLFPRNNKLNADNNDPSREKEESVEAVEDEDVEDNFDDEMSSEQSEIAGYPKDDRMTLDDEGNLDEEISLAAQNMPSSVGITFFARGNCDTINCNVSFATYRHAKASDCRIPFTLPNPDGFVIPSELASFVEYEADTHCLHLITGGLSRKMVYQLKERDVVKPEYYGVIDALYKLSSQLKNGYVREPHRLIVTLDFSGDDYIDNNTSLDGTNAKLTALRRLIEGDVYSITVMLVNDDDHEQSGTECLFQPEIKISTEDNKFSFIDYSGIIDFESLDPEEQSLELQYRNRRAFGSGLGTSVSWSIDENGKGSIQSDFFPEEEIPNMDFSLPVDSNVPLCALSMKHLSDLDSTDKIVKIREMLSIIDAYDSWIRVQETQIPTLDSKFASIAASNMQGCRKSHSRMKKGLDILAKNDLAWNAFELANRAMYMQRVHLKIQAKTANIDRFPDDQELSELLDQIDYYSIDQSIKDLFSWRPFQIAFLLMSIEAIVDDCSADRNLVDLIWFPTGGGKTEAYLGLTAFTIFYRRLSHFDCSDGTAVIMRYTLRLLAAQQFTRASTLICACEYIRRDAQKKRPTVKNYSLGSEPISIGLWIGSEHTPNRNEKAKEELKQLSEATIGNLQSVKERHNKFQVLKCPWCGTKLVKEVVNSKLIGVFGYRMRNNRHFELFCPQESCYFGQIGILPVQIVDEELYLNPPTLLFGTVDKFAMLPWKREIGNFFGLHTNNRSPELIIQDELHLISGPLGTMVGLYETAIDALCCSKGVTTKIIASTATIRRAKEQCSSLYNRDVCQFPHPGLNADDSFFAREALIDFNRGIFGRRYVGIMPSGKTKAMMEVRAIAALLQSINTMSLPDEVKDKYWTLTVYFNSLKDLGKCSTLVDDDVKDFIKRTSFRLGTARDARMIGRADELTSRVSTTELNETLDKLEKWSYSAESFANKRYPSNVLLATNMISVGIDVARLNVMLMVGQPKLTSEYIQASSRIGRTYPGVAFVLYDGSKSRDRSHFEQFRAYHESFYKFVEPTGATPFSKPARDRALHAVVISLLRHLEPTLLQETDASHFTKKAYSDRINAIKRMIAGRDSSIIGRMNTGIEDDSNDVVGEIDYIIDRWENMAEEYNEGHFSYGEKYMNKSPDSDNGRLMKQYNSDPYDTEAFETMTSVRNVDSTVSGNVLIWED